MSHNQAALDAAALIDRTVAANVRQARILAGLSQEAVGARIGLTFQQIQKYERGTNRIGAGRLYLLAGIYGVGLPSFFGGVAELDFERPGEAADPATAPARSLDRNSLDLLRAFNRLDHAQRRLVISVAAALTDAGAEVETLEGEAA